jgi:preprotein translocase subunit SecG
MKEWFNGNISGEGIVTFLVGVFIISLLALAIRETYKHKDEMRDNQLIEIKGYIHSSDLIRIQKTLVQEE